MSNISSDPITIQPDKLHEIPSTAEVKLPNLLPDAQPDSSTDQSEIKEASDEPSEPQEGDVFDYLEFLISNYSKTMVASEGTFDHLDKFYKLMEQMLNLRDQNAKLNKRIQDLKHLINLAKMQKELETTGAERDNLEINRITEFADNAIESMVTDLNKTQKQKVLMSNRLRPSILRRRRNCSESGKEVEEKDKSSKVSKWTKVKAAFRWEKASTSVVDSKSQDSGIHVPVNLEIARYLRVPSTSDETGHSPVDSGAAGTSTPGSLSTASSNEDFHRSETRTPNEDFRSSEDEHSQHAYIPHSKGEYSSTKLNPAKVSKTPWAKMKDIIQTRNSFKKKHRLSAVSDDIQIDVELCSDNDDNVFDSEVTPRSKQTSPSASPNRSSSQSDRADDSGEISQEVIKRYQKAVEEDGENAESKWIVVKKAFLTNDKPKHSNGASNAEDEIQKNYKKLQMKLSLEFQEKMSEWERLKQHSPGISNPSSSSCGYNEENRYPNFVKKMQGAPRSPLPSEFDLPPDFKKKMEEWEKIQKERESVRPRKKLGDVPKWKSLGGYKCETPTAFEYPVLTEDFKKKLEEWKHIKEGSSAECKKLKDKTPSPKLTRKDSSLKHSKKYKDSEKELHWFDKELGKIEKEKQRLEKERQKFLEREERLTKLRKSVLAGNKKEVLIHTPSGFHRFEGISRKFTQKLYEWEKAQGIGPEASTFALLTSSYTPDSESESKAANVCENASLFRSKSDDSVATTPLSLACPLLNHQPSSLSLNNVDDLERCCFVDSKNSSTQYLLDSQDELDMEEPEAVLVEVEDYEVETAAPLNTIAEKQQLPVYQRQEIKSLCAGETVAAPKVRRSESARAQTSYTLIDEADNILRYLAENEMEIKNITQYLINRQHDYENGNKIMQMYEEQRQFSSRLTEKILHLREANDTVVFSFEEEGREDINEILKAVQNSSDEILQMVSRMDQSINNRTMYNLGATSSMCITIFDDIREIRTRIFQLITHLNFICATSDSTFSNKIISFHRGKPFLHKTTSNESKSSRCDTSDNSRSGSQKGTHHFLKADNSTSNVSQGAVKKRLKFRQKTMPSRSIPDTDEEEDAVEEKRRVSKQHKKLSRGKIIPEFEMTKPVELVKDYHLAQHVLVPTEANYVNLETSGESRHTPIPPDSPVTIFVKTTRKLFTPIGESNIGSESRKCSPKLKSNEIQVQEEALDIKIINTNEKGSTKELSTQISPGLPASPVPQRKVVREISPSIRLILEKYNKKVSEKDNRSIKSGNKSGSNSPIRKSPTCGRRVGAQTERFHRQLEKLSFSPDSKREVRKSFSMGYIHCGNIALNSLMRRDSTQNTLSKREKITEFSNKLTPGITVSYCDLPSRHSLDIRNKKLQQAKEDFLKSTTTLIHISHGKPSYIERIKESLPQCTPNSTSVKSDNDVPKSNRTSQVSGDSVTSNDNVYPGSLKKSRSAGMINIDPDAYKNIDPELHEGGYGTLPRNSVIPKSGKFGLSSITSKFRKVKLRKKKEKGQERLTTVSALCRQSLVVDISKVESTDGQVIGNDVPLGPPAPSGNDHTGEQNNISPSPSSSKSNTCGHKSVFRK